MTLHGDATRSAETAAADELDAALRAFHAGDPSPFAASQRRVVEALRAPLEVRPGTLFGDYRVERRIGEGGMGCVYDALELCSGRRVALKVLRRRDASIDFDPRYWQREAEALARLLHPGVTTLYRAGQVDGSYFLAMEYVEGRRIDDWARELRGTRGAVRPIVEVLASIARTVEFCHRRGVIHLDLKPANILVDRSDRAKILDFGMARLFATADFGPSDWTYDRDKAGTLPYLAPEQLDAARGDIDTRTDVHALGVVFMEILTGTRPYSSSRERPLDVVPRILAGLRSRARTLDPSLDLDIDSVLERALASSPADRYASASELADDLQRFLEGHPVHARARSAWYVVRKFAQRRRQLSCLIVLIALTMVVAVGLVVDAWRSADRAQKATSVELGRAREGARTLARILALTRPESGTSQMSMLDFLGLAERELDQTAIEDTWVEASARAALGMALVHRGAPRRALPQLERALALRRTLANDAGTRCDLLVDLADSLRDLGFARHAAGELEDAIDAQRQALALRRRLHAPNDDRVLQSIEELVEALIADDKRGRALQVIADAVEPSSAFPDARVRLAKSLLDASAPRRAMHVLEAVVPRARSALAADTWASLLESVARGQQQLQLFDLALATRAEIAAFAIAYPGHLPRIVELRNHMEMSRLEHRQGQQEAAVSAMKAALTEVSQILGPASAELSTWRIHYYRMLVIAHKTREAARGLGQTAEQVLQSLGPNHEAYIKARLWQAYAESRDDPHAAAAILAKCKDILVRIPSHGSLVDFAQRIEKYIAPALAR